MNHPDSAGVVNGMDFRIEPHFPHLLSHAWIVHAALGSDVTGATLRLRGVALLTLRAIVHSAIAALLSASVFTTSASSRRKHSMAASIFKLNSRMAADRLALAAA